ncbi:ABC transporter permease [Rhodococcus opacus]|nr:ABC transporter permease [Rhodococcus opacus]
MTLTQTANHAATSRKEKSRPAARGKQRGRQVFIIVARVVLIAAILGMWEWLASSGTLDPLSYGRPSLIWTEILNYLPSAQNREGLVATLLAVLYTFLIGSTSGILFGFALGLNDTLNAIVGPFLAPINSIPRIALAPLFIAWFGLTLTAKVVLGVTIVFFILTEMARSSVRSVNSDIMTMARVGGLSKTALLFKVLVPSAVPVLVGGLRLAFTYSLLGVIASEMIAATNGLGQDIVLYSSSFRINTVFAILVELVAIAVVVNWAFTVAERRLLRWQRT